MDDSKLHLARVLEHKKLASMVFVLSCLVGWVIVACMPNQYETKARIYADTSTILKPLLAGIAIQADSDEKVQIISRTLKSREMLEDIARSSDLYLQYPTETEYEDLLIHLKDSIDIVGSSQNNVYDISYSHKDPIMAMKIVQLTMKKFVDLNTGKTRGDAINATDFLEQQISDYRKKLSSSDKELAEFKKENQENLPALGGGYYHTLTQTGIDIDNVKQSILERKTEIHALRTRFMGGSSGTLALDSATTIYDERISNLNSMVEQLSIRYTDKYPTIIELRDNIDKLTELQKQSQKNIVTRASVGTITPSTNTENPVLQEFAYRISNLEAEIEVLHSRETTLNNKLVSLKSKLYLIPDIEAKLKELTRNYDNDSDYYQKLISRRDSAMISKDANDNTQDIKFVIVDEPRAALKPIGPKRSMFYFAVFLCSAVAGLGLSWLYSGRKMSIHGVEHLESLIGHMKVIGKIQHTNIVARKKTNLNTTLKFGAIFLVMVSILSALVAVEAMYHQSPIYFFSKVIK
jgi:polysaccharide chain length determinant protein (PEP-CTERM system associated)